MVTRDLKIDDLADASKLFDAYRVFYGQESDPKGAAEFLRARILKGDSYLIGVFENESIVGFAQLFPSFSSVAMKPKLILNDMFILPRARRRGAGKALLEATKMLAQRVGAISMVLATKNDNGPAKSLYESFGWQEESMFRYYNFIVPT